jgi:hypothetical protein
LTLARTTVENDGSDRLSPATWFAAFAEVKYRFVGSVEIAGE